MGLSNDLKRKSKFHDAVNHTGSLCLSLTFLPKFNILHMKEVSSPRAPALPEEPYIVRELLPLILPYFTPLFPAVFSCDSATKNENETA